MSEETEAELWWELYGAMDGNLRMSKRRELLARYKAAVLREAGMEEGS